MEKKIKALKIRILNAKVGVADDVEQGVLDVAYGLVLEAAKSLREGKPSMDLLLTAQNIADNVGRRKTEVS